MTAGGKQFWDSGTVASNESTYVKYAGPPLAQGTAYTWSVATTTASSSDGATAPCESAASEPATFITSLFSHWDASANFISVRGVAPTFGYFRKDVVVPSGVVSAQGFVTAVNQDPLLSCYKLYVNGELVDLGPGRGEAPVWDGDGAFRSLPYATLDLTSHFGNAGTYTLAIVGMHSQSPSVLLQVQLQVAGGETITMGTDGTWSAFDADVHRNPGKSTGGQKSAGTTFVEFIDARAEPTGWMHPGFKGGAGWSPANAAPISPLQFEQLHSKMEPKLDWSMVPVRSIRAVAPGPAPGPAPPPPGAPASCVEAAENTNATIRCPEGLRIAAVGFASFGTPKGSCATGFTAEATCNSNHSTAVVSALCMGKASCTVEASCTTFHEKLKGDGAFCWAVQKSLAVNVTCSAGAPAGHAASVPRLATAAAAVAAETDDYLADFGKELQGGLRLEVQDGKAGQTVAIECGEALEGTTVTATWGWQFNWTLRDGPQVLEQHKYMECRFVKLQFSGVAPTNFTLSAWKVHYKWDEEDSMFASSNSTLNAVFELARYTLEAASLDTFTDSNTRERDPYEADGIIAATSRLLIQRDVLWARHSAAYVFQFPTCPVEWMQITPFLAYLDYMWTGQPDLALAFAEQIYNRTMIRFVDLATGLVNTSAIGGYQCHSGRPGMHIIDWMPGAKEGDQTTALGEYTESEHNSVDNMFAARGLEILAAMLSAATAGETANPGGGPAAAHGWARNATQIAATAAALKASIVKQMWNGTNYCDGICKEVNGSSLLMANMFALCFGMVEQHDVEAAWTTVADWGLENIGDYGAFWYQLALSGNSVYADPYETPAGDGGAAMVKALTKCDRDSWCSGLRDDNLTMTRESWHDGTYSHEWGTSPIIGVTWGVMGLRQTAPGFATFTVRPKLGGLAHAAITVPTLRGPITINATTLPQHTLAVTIPCNALATVCMPHTTTVSNKGRYLLLDGVRVEAVSAGAGHLCAAQSIGCGLGGRPRVLQHLL